MINYINLKKAFGWFWRAWSYTCLKLDSIKEILSFKGSILEIGASNRSQVSILFHKAVKKILG